MIGAVKMELAVIAGKRNHVIVIGDDAAYDALPIKIQTAATASRPLLFWTMSMLSTWARVGNHRLSAFLGRPAPLSSPSLRLFLTLTFLFPVYMMDFQFSFVLAHSSHILVFNWLSIAVRSWVTTVIASGSMSPRFSLQSGLFNFPFSGNNQRPLSQIPFTDFNWAEAVTKHGASSRMSLSVRVDSSRRLKDYFDNVDRGFIDCP